MSVVWILSDRRYLGQRMPTALLQSLRAREVPSRCVVADDHVVEIAGSELDPWDGLAAGDVVVARTRDPFGLALLRDAARPGVSVIIPRAVVDGVRDKSQMAKTLADAGIAAPATFLAPRPEALQVLSPERFPLLLKPNFGDNGAGIVFAESSEALARVAGDGDVVLAQSFVDTGGWDVKIYGIGNDVWCVERPSPLGNGAPGAARRIEATADLVNLAQRCREAFGLDLYGVDVLVSKRGPLVVDVNEFPNYTGIADAPALLGALVLGRLGGSPPGEAAA